MGVVFLRGRVISHCTLCDKLFIWNVEDDCRKIHHILFFILFCEEISACAAVHTHYVMDAYDCVWSIILLPRLMGMSFVLVALTRMNVSETKHWVTWSHRTSINLWFLREKEFNNLVFLLNQFLTHFYLWWKLHLKNWEFLFAFKTFLEETKKNFFYQSYSLARHLELIWVWWKTIFVLN